MLVVALLPVTGPVGPVAAVAAGSASTVRVSVGSDGTQGDGVSRDPAVSADGQVVAFQSAATGLVAGDTNGAKDVFVHDRGTGTTVRVSVASDGTQGEGLSEDPALSADGRYVAFRSLAKNLVAGDSNHKGDIFVHDRATGTTSLVSVAGDGTQGNGHALDPSISADGTVVAFTSAASTLVAGDTNGVDDVFVRDLAAGTTVRVSVASDGTQANGASEDSELSADGSTVAFLSAASTLVAGDTNAVDDIFVHDRTAGTTGRVSVADDGSQANGTSNNPGLSADGTMVVFDTDATNLAAGDTNAKTDVYVHDRTAGTTARVSVATDGTEGTSGSDAAEISDDGHRIAFYSYAPNLVAGDTNGRGDIFVHDRTTATTGRVSVASDGTQADGPSDGPDISADGTTAVFASDATNLVAGDTNSLRDVVAHITAPVQPVAVEITTPTFGTTTWGSVPLSATTSGGAGIDRVEYTVNGAVVGTATTAPYSVTWDSTTVPDGDHLITATAYDVAGTSAEDAVGVRVANALDVTGQLDADFDEGRITADEYMLNAVYALFGDPALDARYTGTVPEHPSG